MNKEILQEMLQELDDIIIPNEKWNKIKDYMIILQSENEKLIVYKNKLESELNRKINQYEFLRHSVPLDVKDKEIKRLNNKIKEQSLLLIEFQDMEQKLDIYKSKCEKALHLIKHNDIYDYRVFEEKLKNILNGD